MNRFSSLSLRGRARSAGAAPLLIALLLGALVVMAPRALANHPNVSGTTSPPMTVPRATATLPEPTTSQAQPDAEATTTTVIASSISTVLLPATTTPATTAAPTTVVGDREAPEPSIAITTAAAQVLGDSESRPVSGDLPTTGRATELMVRFALVLLVGGCVLLLKARRQA